MFCIIKKEIRRNKKVFCGYVAIISLVWLGGIIIPYLSGTYINCLVKEVERNVFATLIMLIAVVSLLQIGFRYVQSLLSTKLSYYIVYQISNDIFQRIFCSEYKYYGNIDSAYYIDQINKDSNAVVSFLTSNIVNFFLQSATIITSAMLIFCADKLLCVIIIALIPFYILTFQLSKSKMFVAKDEMKKASNAYFSRYAEQINKLAYIKRNVLNQEMSHRLESSCDRLLKASLRSVSVEYLFSNLNQLVILMAYLCIIGIGGYKVSIGTLSIGYFSIINTYFNMIISSVSYFVGLAGSYQDTKVSFKRIQKIMNTPEETMGSKSVGTIHKIQIDKLAVYYGEVKALENFNYSFEQGKIYGLCGQNGGGKTTLLNAVMGIFAGEHSGQIFYNDINIEDANISAIRRHDISYLDQDPVMLNMSVKEYLEFGLDLNENMKKNQKELLKIWEIDYLLDKTMNENGSNFSGGEKQKLALVRALSKDSSLLLLDEPTSALDKDSIIKLMALLQERKRQSIILMISHDPSVLQQCDVVLDVLTMQQKEKTS